MSAEQSVADPQDHTAPAAGTWHVPSERISTLYSMPGWSATSVSSSTACRSYSRQGTGGSGNTLYLHGSSANRSLLTSAGQQVCVTVTLLDGLVCARAVFHHSMNYRSAVIFGEARLVTEPEEKLAALRAVTDHLVPGRWEHVREPNRKELAATAVLALPLDEASVKVRAGGPKDDEEDYDSGIWAGVLPAALTFGAAEPDPALTGDVPVPGHIAPWPAGCGERRLTSPAAAERGWRGGRSRSPRLDQ